MWGAGFGSEARVRGRPPLFRAGGGRGSAGTGAAGTGRGAAGCGTTPSCALVGGFSVRVKLLSCVRWCFQIKGRVGYSDVSRTLSVSSTHQNPETRWEYVPGRLPPPAAVCLRSPPGGSAFVKHLRLPPLNSTPLGPHLSIYHRNW